MQIERSITTEADISQRALDCVLQYATRNNNRFLHGTDKYFNTPLDGTIKDIGSHREICILKSIVDRTLTENGFESLRDIYGMWKETNILSSEKDRPYKRKVLVKGLPEQPCFVFKFKKQ